MIRYPILGILFTSLVACGPAPDIADNIPKVGKWSDNMQLLSVDVNGAAVDRSDLGDSLPKDSSREFCGEPYVRTEAELRSTLLTDELRGCTISSYENDGSQHRISGSCEGMIAGADDSSAVMSFAGRSTENELKGRLSVQAFVTRPEGEGESVNIEYERRMTRLGDC